MAYSLSPKKCADCGRKYAPKSGAQQRCPKCKAKRDKKAKPHHEPRACRGCGEAFTPRASAECYCKRCRARRKAMGSALYKDRRLAADPEDVSPAKPVARPGDFVAPTGSCHRCAAVVRLDRPEEYHVVARPGGKRWVAADRLLLCLDCWRERRLKEISGDVPADGIFSARTAAATRCLTILLSLDRPDRRAAWAQLERSMEAVRA